VMKLMLLKVDCLGIVGRECYRSHLSLCFGNLRILLVELGYQRWEWAGLAKIEQCCQSMLLRKGLSKWQLHLEVSYLM
jgi:hypothetical protein